MAHPVRTLCHEVRSTVLVTADQCLLGTAIYEESDRSSLGLPHNKISGTMSLAANLVHRFVSAAAWSLDQTLKRSIVRPGLVRSRRHLVSDA